MLSLTVFLIIILVSDEVSAFVVNGIMHCKKIDITKKHNVNLLETDFKIYTHFQNLF